MDYLFGQPDRRLDGGLEDLRSTPATVNEVSWAASSLRFMRTARKGPKKWSGFVRGRRVWRGQSVLLPDGSVGEIYGARRGRVVVKVSDPRIITGEQIIVANQDEVKIIKSACAILLGSRKKGTSEQPSLVKAAAAHANGRKPCAPGKRRGRPQKGLPQAPVDRQGSMPAWMAASEKSKALAALYRSGCRPSTA